MSAPSGDGCVRAAILSRKRAGTRPHHSSPRRQRGMRFISPLSTSLVCVALPRSSSEPLCHAISMVEVESAYARLKACCNPTGDQRLTFGQVLRLMAFCECYDPLYHACDDTLHARPDRKAPEDEAVKLVEVINNAAQTM